MKEIAILLTLTFFLLTACSINIKVDESAQAQGKVVQNATVPVQDNTARNVILLIGDGMGINQITAAMYSYEGRFHLERFEETGLHKNHEIDDLIPDSAAGATSFACGVKTFNGGIGVGPDSSIIPTILEEAEQRGYGTGMVVTSEIVHATPAAFIAHEPSRNNYEEIAAWFTETEIDYFVGGGMKYFTRRQKDERDIASELKARGYTISSFIEAELKGVDLSGVEHFGYFTADDKPLPVMQGRDYFEEASMKGIDFLNKRPDRGFFMMIESSQIDWGGHSNNLNYIVEEMKEFDEVIGKVLDFAIEDGETLVLVTADHECGGLTINYGSTRDSLNVNFSSGGHTLSLIPVFAYGPGADSFGGIYDNTEIYHKMRAALGWD